MHVNLKSLKENEPIILYCLWIKPVEMARSLRVFLIRQFQGKYSRSAL